MTFVIHHRHTAGFAGIIATVRLYGVVAFEFVRHSQRWWLPFKGQIGQGRRCIIEMVVQYVVAFMPFAVTIKEFTAKIVG